MSAQHKFTDREKEFKQRRKCGNAFQHKQNTFALMETTMSKNSISMRTFKTADIKFRKKILENQLKIFSTEQCITHVNVVLAVPFQLQNWFQGPPNNT